MEVHSTVHSLTLRLLYLFLFLATLKFLLPFSFFPLYFSLCLRPPPTLCDRILALSATFSDTTWDSGVVDLQVLSKCYRTTSEESVELTPSPLGHLEGFIKTESQSCCEFENLKTIGRYLR